jgi:hypothetical protein
MCATKNAKCILFIVQFFFEKKEHKFLLLFLKRLLHVKLSVFEQLVVLLRDLGIHFQLNMNLHLSATNCREFPVAIFCNIVCAIHFSGLSGSIRFQIHF